MGTRETSALQDMFQGFKWHLWALLAVTAAMTTGLVLVRRRYHRARIQRTVDMPETVEGGQHSGIFSTSRFVKL